MQDTTEKRHDLLIRIGGLLLIGLVGVLVAACGLALCFGHQRLSGILFFITISLLGLMKITAVILKK